MKGVGSKLDFVLCHSDVGHTTVQYCDSKLFKMSFAPNRSILNPKFEGYKLSPVSELDAIHQFPLPGSGISQSTVSGGTHLAFQEVQSRVRQNHLAISVADPGIFAYIDKDFNFIIVAVEQVNSKNIMLSFNVSDITVEFL